MTHRRQSEQYHPILSKALLALLIIVIGFGTWALIGNSSPVPASPLVTHSQVAPSPTITRHHTVAVKPSKAPKKAHQAVRRAVYTVKAGDTLWAIAGRAYHDPLGWHRLYALNRHIIGVNPNLIRPGQVLRL